MKKDIMLDIETLGNGSNSVIVSISAVIFDLTTGEVGTQFVVGLDIDEQLEHGAHMDASTVLWWLAQSKDAREALLSIPREPVSQAIKKLGGWLTMEIPELSSASLWGNGSVFDNVIIRNLYRRHAEWFPLPFWADKDVRTLVTLAGIDTRDYVFEGTKHVGIDDCMHQIKYCHAGYVRIHS